MTGKKEPPAPKEGEEAEEGAEKEAEEQQAEGEDVPAGVPEFWLNVLRNFEEIGEKVSYPSSTPFATLVCIDSAQLASSRVFIHNLFNLLFHV